MHRSLRRPLGALLALALLTMSAAPALAVVPSRASKARSVRDVVIGYRDGSVDTADVRSLKAALGRGGRRLSVGKGVARLDDLPEKEAEAVAARLRRLPGVSYAAAMGPIEAVALPTTPSDAKYASQRTYLRAPTSGALGAIALEAAWEKAFASGENALHPDAPAITVAVIDTGIRFGFREDPGSVVAGYDYVNDDRNPSDDNWVGGVYHGTRVASIIKAQADNRYGMAGVARGTKVRLLAYKVLNYHGSGSGADAVVAIRDAADAGAKVINCSFAGDAGDYERIAWEDAVSYAARKGAVVVAASGNSNSEVQYPAAATKAIAVGALNPVTGARSSFSNYGPRLDLAAPGQNILTANPYDSVAPGDGTSFASPLVAGSLAFLWSLVPGASATYMSSLLTESAVDVGATGFDDQYGHGRLNVWAAYQRMIADFPQQSAPTGLRTVSMKGILANIAWDGIGTPGAVYRYGYVGGPEYKTSTTAAQLPMNGSGTATVYVRAYSPGAWNDSAVATMSVTVPGSRPAIRSQRFGSSNVYSTAEAASRSRFPSGASRVVIAPSAIWMDALSAAPLAEAARGPLLLTSGSKLPYSVRNELVRLDPDVVYVVGGPATIRNSVLSSIAKVTGAKVIRVSGRDRYETSGRVADKVRSLKGGSIPSRRAIVVSGEKYPDALSAGPLAARQGWPILLTPGRRLASATSAALRRNGIRRTIVVGGTASVSTGTLRKLPSPTRISGRDRYEASRRLADYAIARSWLTPADVGLASGTRFQYALSAAGLMASRRGPVVLCDTLTSSTRSWLRAKGTRVTRVDLFGPVTRSTENAVLATLRP